MCLLVASLCDTPSRAWPGTMGHQASRFGFKLQGGVSREGDETSQPQPDAARTASSPDNTGAEATAPAEDWRAFRARLVQREMQDCGQAAEQSTNEQEPVTTTALQQVMSQGRSSANRLCLFSG